VEEFLLIERNLDEGFSFWTSPLFEADERGEYKEDLGMAREFLDGLQHFDTPGRFKNFRSSQKEVQAHAKGLARLKELKQIRAMLQDVEEKVSYLSIAQALFPEDSDLYGKMSGVKRDIINLLKDKRSRSDQHTREDIGRRLEELK
jgi:hypothetical protein